MRIPAKKEVSDIDSTHIGYFFFVGNGDFHKKPKWIRTDGSISTMIDPVFEGRVWFGKLQIPKMGQPKLESVQCSKYSYTVKSVECTHPTIRKDVYTYIVE